MVVTTGTLKCGSGKWGTVKIAKGGGVENAGVEISALKNQNNDP